LEITEPGEKMVTPQIEEASILELSSSMAAGETSAHELTAAHLDRIEKLDRSGPAINAVIETNPDALAIASALDQERAAGKIRGPLHGIPILVKDNIDTHDRLQTASGSLALEGNIAARDAFLVERLRSAGAIILGKANLSEWANFRGMRSVSGWSSRGGLTRNPYALDRSACGSSSGSAAAVSASLCAGAFGTETDGSIICPSQTCGVVGLKPTLGLISRSGIIPIAHSQDSAGPIGRTVEDVAILLGAVVGVDPQDHATRSSEKRYLNDYTRYLVRDGLKGKRIGVSRNMLGTDKRTTAILEASLDVMNQEGAVIVDPADLPNWDEFGESELEVLYFEFKSDLNRYLQALGPQARVHSLEDVIKFNEDNKARVMPYFGQGRMLAAQKKGPLTTRKYREALARNHRLTRSEGIDALMVDNKLDAVVVVSGGPAWNIDLANGDPSSWDMESTSPAAVAGYPHITVPAGEIFGLPVGISFFARAWREPELLKIAYAFEQALKARKPPRFLPTAEFSVKIG
jgi:amidase